MKVGRARFDRVVAAVHAAGVDEALEAVLRSGQGGRPRGIRMDVYVAAMILTVETGGRLTLKNVHRLLTQGLPHSAQLHYGIRQAETGPRDALTYRQITYPLEALAKKLPTRDGKIDGQLQGIMDLIVKSSLPDTLPAVVTLALDNTAIASWARGKSRWGTSSPGEEDAATPAGQASPTAHRVSTSADTDATWGYRTKTFSNGSSSVFGYHMFTVVGVPEVGAVPDAFPILTWGMTVRPANADAAEPGLAVIDNLRACGHRVSGLLADREFAHLLAHRWAQPLRERDIKADFDLHPHDRGVRDYEGLRMVDGWPHCPAMPDEMITIPRPPRFEAGPLSSSASVKERADHEAETRAINEFSRAIAARQQYAFRRVAGPDATGKERYECPAQAGKLKCKNCPLSELYGDAVPTVDNPPTGAGIPTCCTQRTVTVPGDVTPKTRQRFNWGTPEWIASYSRRTYVEGSYGNLKNPNTENVTRGWCNVYGMVKTSLLLAVAVAASNIRLLLRRAERTGVHDCPLSIPDPKYQPWEETDAAGAILRHDPPAQTDG